MQENEGMRHEETSAVEEANDPLSQHSSGLEHDEEVG